MGSMATRMTGSGNSMDSRMMGAFSSHRVSPVVVFFRPTGGLDIAGEDLLDILPVVGVHLQDPADALLDVLGAVQHGGTGGQMAGIDAEEAQTAHIGVSHDS